MGTAEVVTDRDLRRATILRRYMDLPKLVDLLRSRTLYLRRADGFSDRFEGALTPLIRKAMDDAHKSGKSSYGADYFYRRGRIGSFVSCWSIGARDNMALWQIYGGVKTCVAVTTTVEKLIEVALSWREPVLIHRVKYIDRLRSPDMIVGRYSEMLRYKHEAYAYEKELRLIVPRQGKSWERNPAFLRMPLQNLEDLVRSVVVAPEAEDWFVDEVSDLAKLYGLDAPIRRSKLAFMKT